MHVSALYEANSGKWGFIKLMGIFTNVPLCTSPGGFENDMLILTAEKVLWVKGSAGMVHMCYGTEVSKQTI